MSPRIDPPLYLRPPDRTHRRPIAPLWILAAGLILASTAGAAPKGREIHARIPHADPAPGALQERAGRAAARDAFLEWASTRYRTLSETRTFAGRVEPRTVLTPYAGPEPVLQRRGDGPRSDWTPYAGPFGAGEAAHLLHRTMIGTNYPEIEAASQAGLNATVTDLLAPRAMPEPPGPWAHEPLPDTRTWTQEMVDSLFTLYYTRFEIMRLWWCEEMIAPDPGMRETMTLFWHDHFASSQEKVFIPSSMCIQNEIFRTYAAGNFKDLVYAASFDPAMLIWLDGIYNYAGDVNENFARELLELFTMGVDEYTQADVVAAARAFTGYTTYDGVTTIFIPGAHDYGTKTFLNHTGPLDAPDIIDIIFEQPQTATFLCRKLYQYFVDQYPDPALIEDLAQTLRDNDYEIAPVLSRMLMSEHFMDVDFRGSVYTDGIDRGVGMLRALQVEGVDLSDVGGVQAQWVQYCMYLQGLILFQPPNVGGWPGYRSWLNSYTLPWKRWFALSLVEGELFGTDLEMQIDAIDLALGLSNPNDPNAIVDDMAVAYFGQAPTASVRQQLLDSLLQGMSPNEWTIFRPDARARLENLVRMVVKMPDFQLK